MHTLTRRSVLTGTLATSIALALAACSDDGGSGADTSASIAPDTKAELTLAYWDKSQTPTIDANIKSFNETYPNITVTTNLTAYADYWKKLRTQAEGRTLPDVMWMNGPNIQLYAGNDMLEPLDDVTAAGIAWSDYPTSLVDLYTYQGVHYAIPKDYDTIGVFYNKTLFASAGAALPTEDWTWEDFHTAARTISAWGKDQGIWGCATTVNGDGQGTYYNTIAQAGGYVIKDGRSGFDNPASVKGLQCWADWIADGSVGNSGDVVKAIACGADAVMLGAALARAVWEAGQAPGAPTLLLGSSMTVRRLDRLAQPGAAAPKAVANRGLAGIDGTIATGIGLWMASGEPVRAVMGDLAFLHDAMSLNRGVREEEADLQVIVVDDGGGAIFSHLEYARTTPTGRFERLFTAPQRADIAALAAALGARVQVPHDVEALRGLLAEPVDGVSVVVWETTRHGPHTVTT